MIDFNRVLPQHADIHQRLNNWGRWSNPKAAGCQIQPMFRGYEPYLVPRESSGASMVDVLDAQAVQKVMHQIPEKIRMALQWGYVHPYIHHAKVARKLGVNFGGLRDLLDKGRSMVRNLVTKKMAESA